MKWQIERNGRYRVFRDLDFEIRSGEVIVEELATTLCGNIVG